MTWWDYVTWGAKAAVWPFAGGIYRIPAREEPEMPYHPGADPYLYTGGTPQYGAYSPLDYSLSPYAQPYQPSAVPGYGQQLPTAPGMVSGLAQPRSRLLTVTTRVYETGQTEIVDAFKGRAYLSSKDMSSFRKVVRLAKRLRSWMPARRRSRKGKR